MDNNKKPLVFDPEALAYKAEIQSNPKDSIGVVVGDDKDLSKFQPQVKLQRWDNEVNTSVRLQLPGDEEEIVYEDEKGVVWEKGNYETHFYERDDIPDGGFEFEIHLKEIPVSNTFKFSVNTKELDWLYQPALTQEEINQGARRPEEIVGSYAVYHKQRGSLYSDQKDYKTGKAFHVYRPHAIDSQGNRIWGKLSLDKDGGILTVTIDRRWLEEAVYPVIVDPTFGNTNAGASNTVSSSDVMTGNTYDSPGSGTIISLHVYGQHTSGNNNIQVGVYDINNDLVANTGDISISTSTQWYSGSATGSFNTSPSWLLFNVSSGSFRFYYDSGAEDGYLLESQEYGTWPASITGTNRFGNIIPSIYATYSGTIEYTKDVFNKASIVVTSSNNQTTKANIELEVEDQVQTSNNVSAGFGEWSIVRYRGQGFTPTYSQLTGIGFQLTSTGSARLKVYLFAGDTDSLPTGGEIYSWIIPNGDLSTSFKKYDLPVAQTLTPGSQYCFYLAPWHATNDEYVDNYRDARWQSSNVYAGGKAIVNTNGTWSVADGGALDMYFKTYSLYEVVGVEQEGYRWRNDDGSETTATWVANQDTAITREGGLNTRLRILLNATGNPGPKNMRLEYKPVGGDEWKTVEVES